MVMKKVPNDEYNIYYLMLYIIFNDLYIRLSYFNIYIYTILSYIGESFSY